MNDPISQFHAERAERITLQGKNKLMKTLAHEWIKQSMEEKYVYNFEWLGRPIIQYPEDMIALQELVWKVKPDLIIETGIAHGGSLMLSASMLALLDYCDATESGIDLAKKSQKRKVIGVDIDIREHNRLAIEQHPLAHKIEMIQGSSVACETVKKVEEAGQGFTTVMVMLDSNHTHEHVLEELKLYSPFVSKGSYCIVFDSFVEDMPENFIKDRPWNKGNNPKTAVWDFIEDQSDFIIDRSIDDKLLISCVPDGFLLRTG